jgi:hypothetical protein
VPMAFYAGCSSRQIGGHDGSITTTGLLALARTKPTAVLVPAHARPPAYARSWRVVKLPDRPSFHGYDAYIAPSASGTPTPR